MKQKVKFTVVNPTISSTLHISILSYIFLIKVWRFSDWMDTPNMMRHIDRRHTFELMKQVVSK